MKVLITRPEEDAAQSARQLAALGHEAIIAPLLAAEFHDGKEPGLADVQAILFTSANGVRAFARRSGRRDIKVFAVGPQTTAEAGQAGFATIRNAEGNAQRLGEVVLEEARPAAGALIHVHGGEGGALAQTLRGQGYEVREEVLYRVKSIDLPQDAADLLKQAAVEAALFFSPRSAGLFRELALRHALPTGAMIAACISPATAAALAPLAFAEIRVAPAPNQSALLALL